MLPRLELQTWLHACGHDWTSWTQWRTTSLNNRIMWLWKVLSTLLLMTYLYTFMGVVFLLKLLIEIWSQQTPTWIAPSTWPLLIGLSLWRRLRLAHAFC